MEDCNNWTLKDLRSELKRRNARTSGRKHELVNLLEFFDRNCNFSSFSNAPVDTVDPMSIFSDISIFRTVTEDSLSEFPIIYKGQIEQYVLFRQAHDTNSHNEKGSLERSQTGVNAIAEDTRWPYPWARDDRKCCVTRVHTMHVCFLIHDAMTTLTGKTHKRSNRLAELGKSCIKRDNDDFKKIRAWIERHTHLMKTSLIPYSESKIEKKDQIKTLEALEVGVRIDKEKVHVDPIQPILPHSFRIR
ncbi:unnamed protein product [Lepeophtheirus salmonis]|uniref:(salmon louse) hypothetical protein n=1 Tax=Lepeophtheirus salmonis TaxID=72036 RepID=A0A7R8D1D8_LEPSM|nr:unnamed protein product [Lepeophtheirus salmonis]CAF2968195.1 unnamed protein product [Lepeophtheirus salmonis]